MKTFGILINTVLVNEREKMFMSISALFTICFTHLDIVSFKAVCDGLVAVTNYLVKYHLNVLSTLYITTSSFSWADILNMITCKLDFTFMNFPGRSL